MNELDIIIRLALAVVVGFLIGLEREKHHRPAGIKTHILVCVGAAVISLIQLEIIDGIIRQVEENPSLANVIGSDHGRMGAQVISGIGFLGAGTIIRTRGSVKGLTTAATLWISACLGLGIGMGYYFITLTAFALVMTLLIILKFFQMRVLDKKGMKDIDVILVNKKMALQEISQILTDNFIRVKKIDFPDEQEEDYHYGDPVLRCTFTVLMPKDIEVQSIINELNMQSDVVKAQLVAEE